MKSPNLSPSIKLIVCINVIIICVFSLSGSEISQKCHCDLTSSFCDFGCCCDTDCGSTISESCFYQKSSFYCPKTDFFKKIKPGSASNNMCYYYNASTTLIDEQTLTNTQRTQIIAQSVQTSPSSSTINAGYTGYKMSTIVTIGGKSVFSFVDNSGNCLNSTSTNLNFKFRFGLNTKFSCNCNNCGTPLLFSDIMGKTIPQFLDISNNDLQTPSVADSSMTTLRLNFIIGKYGSQKTKFIDKITYSFQSSQSTVRTLYINFIDSDNIKEQENSASFFPQIPLDMFYPIHVMS